MTIRKKTKLGLLVVVIFLCFVVGGGTLFMFDVSLKSKVMATDEEDAYTYLFEHEYLKNWIDSLKQASALCDTFVISNDGVKLHALYIRAAQPSDNTALIVHGYTDNSIRMLMIGHLYNKELGYNIILPDLRAHGKSEGEYIQMGWKDRLDILGWINVAKKIYGDSTRMVMHGISMGGAAIMMASGEALPDNIKCFVEDCGYTSVWDEFAYNLKIEYGLPAFPLMYTTSLYTKMRIGWNFKEASSLNQIRKCNLPMFFIHGALDNYVPTWMVYELFEAKQGEKELWIAADSKHATSYWDHTEKYVSRTRTFVSRYMY